MKAAVGFLFALMTAFYIYMAVNIPVIWPDQPQYHMTVQTTMWGFAAGVMFCAAIMSLLNWARSVR
jgi:zinc transporter ZupT